MIGTKIKMLRKKNGYSQEVLAEKLNVVRQTISKWEKELSVPDAAMLKNIAEVFEVPVSELLDSKVPEQDEKVNLEAIAQQLAIMNEQYADYNLKRKKVIKYIGVAIACIFIVCILGAILPKWNEIWYEFGKNFYHMING